MATQHATSRTRAWPHALLSGTTELADTSEPADTSCEASVEDPRGVVRVELAPAEGDLTTFVAGSDPGSGFTTSVLFQRSNDRVTWTSLATPAVGLGTTNASIQLPPSAFAILDAPGLGMWHYRAAISRSGVEGDAGVTNVRLALTTY